MKNSTEIPPGAIFHIEYAWFILRSESRNKL